MVDRQHSNESLLVSSSDCGFEAINNPHGSISDDGLSDDDWNLIGTSICPAEQFFIGEDDSPRASNHGSEKEEVTQLQAKGKEQRNGNGNADLLHRANQVRLGSDLAEVSVSIDELLEKVSDSEKFVAGSKQMSQLQKEVMKLREREHAAVVEVAKLRGAMDQLLVEVANHEEKADDALRRAKEETASAVHRESMTVATVNAPKTLKRDLSATVEANASLKKISAASAIEAESLNKSLATAAEANANFLKNLNAVSAAEAESLNNFLAHAAIADAIILEKVRVASALEVESLNKRLVAAVD